MRPIALTLLLCSLTSAQAPIPGTITTYAGNGKAPFTGDGKKATDVQLYDIYQISFDGANNMYLADYYYDRVFKITPAGIISAIAGNDNFGYAGDNVKGTATSLYGPRSVAAAPNGTVFIGDVLNNRIRQVAPNGTISTAAGGGDFNGTGVKGPVAELHCPESIALNSAGNLAIYTHCDKRLLMMDATGLLYTIGGNGQAGPLADGTVSYRGPLGSNVNGLASDQSGNWYLAVDNRIRKIDTSYIITTIAGGDNAGFAGDGGPATAAQFNAPFRLTADKTGNLFVPDQQNHRIRKIDSKGIVTTIAGNGVPNTSPENAVAVSSPIALPSSVALDSTGTVYFAEQGSRRVRKILANGEMVTVAGRGVPDVGDGGPLAASGLIDPQGIAVGPDGAVYISDQNDHRVRRVDPATGIISTLAGIGIAGFSGDNGPASNAQLNSPRAVAVDANGNVFVSDTGNNIIRKVTPDGTITTVAGSPGTVGAYGGDNGPALSAQLNAPQAVAFDASGNMYIADYLNHRIRMVDANGTMTTFAGDGTYTNLIDGAPANASSMGAPVAMLFDALGTMYVTSAANSRLRAITPDGVVNTIAGGDGSLGQAYGLAMDAAGNLFISESSGTVKMFSGGVLSPVVGNSGSYAGDGGAALDGTLNNPRHMAFLSDGSLLVVDAANKRVRRLTFNSIHQSMKSPGK